MTYLKSKLILTAAAFTMAATPALAGHHEEGKMMSTMAKAEMEMKCKAMAKMSDDVQMAMAAKDPKMAAKCKVMMTTGMDSGDMNVDSMKDKAVDHMKDGAMHKADGMMKTDGMLAKEARMETTASTGSTMITSDAMVTSSLSLEEQNMMRKKIMNNMSDSERLKFGTMSPEDRNNWMNKKIMMKTQAQGGAITTKVYNQVDTVGEIIQADGEVSVREQSDGELLMSNGKQMTKEQLIMKDSDNMAKDNAIVVPTIGSNVLTTVSCPVGTTAQPNGTCMITGNYDFK